MTDVESDYKRPLKELFLQLNLSAQKSTIKKERQINIYFAFLLFWLILIITISLVIIFMPELNVSNESQGKWIQRFGSMISLLIAVGELLFIHRLSKLIKVSHWAQLTCEIYIERKCKIILNISIFLTSVFIIFGAVVSSYGDLFYEYFIH
ncbi:hypothetical protein [Moritella sp.]|uniref:hypothetical protein n=1 Tax=Moritella sp. TaxID=78556 RepID=UPI0025EEE1AE|nr:hypothetical protein [Moritella sp.]MCJ8348316.1 hypothetical protein [Moritella sp.]